MESTKNSLHIQDWAKFKGSSLSNIAQSLGISSQSLSQRLRSDMRVSSLLQIAEVLKVPIEDLFESPYLESGAKIVDDSSALSPIVEDFAHAYHRLICVRLGGERRRKGVTEDQIADAVGLECGVIRAMESGTCPISIAQMIRYAELNDCYFTLVFNNGWLYRLITEDDVCVYLEALLGKPLKKREWVRVLSTCDVPSCKADFMKLSFAAFIRMLLRFGVSLLVFRHLWKDSSAKAKLIRTGKEAATLSLAYYRQAKKQL